MTPTLLRPGRRVSLVLLALLAGAFSITSVSAIETEVVPLDSTAMNQQLAGKTIVEFVVLPTGEISTKDGTVVPVKELTKHLKRTKAPKDAYYLFWIAQGDQLPLAKAAIERCSRHGATLFAVRHLEPRSEDSPASEPPPDAPANGKRTLVMVPGVNPKAQTAEDAPLDFSGRPEHLRPPLLPSRVRCEFAPDAVVIAAAEAAQRLFLATEAIDTALLGDSMILQPGGWKHVGKVKDLAGSKRIESGVQLGSRVIKLEGRFLSGQAQVTAVVARVRELLAKDGGGSVRALTREEMNEWWTFIAFDIEEPVFIIASKRGKYRFLAGFGDDGRLLILDELNALPRQ